jgi:hypothetical protein
MKRTFIHKTSALAALLFVTGSAFAAGPTATLQVKGTITPAACTPTLSNAGIVDFGATSTSEFGAANLALGEKDIDLNVSCTGPTKLQFSMTDNRHDTATSSGEYDLVGRLGLGMTTKSEKIGYFVLWVHDAVVDGVAGDVIASNNTEAIWHKNVYHVNNVNIEGSYDDYVSVATSGTVTPIAFEEMTMKLSPEVVIDKSMKSITEVANLDGNLTLNFDYL